MGVNRYLGGVISADPNTPTVESASGTWTLAEAYQNIGNWPMAQSQIQNSLRFNSADSAYLSRTPSVAGNRKTWTISVWVKRSTLGGDGWVYDGGSTSNSSGFEFSDDKIRIQSTSSSGAVDDVDLKTTAVYRDPSAWYHVVLAVDTTQTTSTNRVKLYVNGSQVTSFSTTTYPSLNYEFGVNNTNSQKIGKWNISTGRDFNGYLTEFNLIDGLALDADYFGFTDANGIWQPKPYKGAYGTNGFYLPMNQSGGGDFAADFLVVAGGGGGGRRVGGGAGGYRTSFGAQSGGGSSAESPAAITLGVSYTVTVGAGGTGTVETNDNTVTQAYNGNNSVFASITSTGGGAGGTQLNTAGNGGSGGGGGDGSTTGLGTSGQGYRGGTSGAPGGGGSAAVGVSASPGAGGSGQDSSITGSSVARGGGGGGSSNSSGAGGYGGGGAGATYNGYNAQSGTANTGGGGGATGGGASTAYGGNGGSGVVIIRIPSNYTATFSGGVTSSLSTSVSGYKIYTVTATSTTSETVTFS